MATAIEPEIIEAGSPEWHAIRATGIGASEAAAACGLSKWEQTIELYLRKRGEAPPKDETRAMVIGTEVEQSICRIWSRLNGQTPRYPLATVRHPEFPFILATPDAELSVEEGLEFKAMGSYRARQVEKYGLAEIIPEYVCQAQQQMAVMGWKVVRLVALVDMEIHEWPIERNERLINVLIGRETVFWDHVQRGVPPDLDFNKAGALRAVQALYPEIHEGAIVRLDSEASEAWRRIRERNAINRENDNLNELDKARVLSRIGSNYAGVLDDGSAMIRRKKIAATRISYERKEYVDVREVKYKGEPIRGLPALAEAEPEDLVAEADVVDLVNRLDWRLKQAGFLCNEVSRSGSRYYVHGKEELRVRVSDHEPNLKTTAWMKRCGVRSIRTNKGIEAAMSELRDVLQLADSDH